MAQQGAMQRGAALVGRAIEIREKRFGKENPLVAEALVLLVKVQGFGPDSEDSLLRALDIDVLISAPQKGWSASPCAGLVLLSERARERVMHTQSTSFACDLKKWLEVMETYERGGHMYHATMPTDALVHLRDALLESQHAGLPELQRAQAQLGARVRAALESAGYASVAADGVKAPSGVVSYTDDPEIASGKKLRELGLQVAAGVPLACDEPASFRTFRVGLFGLDKLQNIDRSVSHLTRALDLLR